MGFRESEVECVDRGFYEEGEDYYEPPTERSAGRSQ